MGPDRVDGGLSLRCGLAETSISRAFESLVVGGDKAFTTELHRKRALLLLHAESAARRVDELKACIAFTTLPAEGGSRPPPRSIRVG